MNAVDDIVMATLANVCNIERNMITADTVLADVGFDSLGAGALASEMEADHGIEIEPEDLAKLYTAVTASDIIVLIRGLVRQHAGSDRVSA